MIDGFATLSMDLARFASDRQDAFDWLFPPGLSQTMQSTCPDPFPAFLDEDAVFARR